MLSFRIFDIMLRHLDRMIFRGKIINGICTTSSINNAIPSHVLTSRLDTCISRLDETMHLSAFSMSYKYCVLYSDK
jgi:hypothetical protein